MSRPRTLVWITTRRCASSRLIVGVPSTIPIVATCDSRTRTPSLLATHRLPMASGSLRNDSPTRRYTPKRRWPSSTSVTRSPPTAVVTTPAVRDIQPVARQVRAPRPHHKLRFAADLLHLQVRGTRNAGDRVLDCTALFLQHRQVVAEQLDGDLRLHARQQLIDAVADRLRNADRHPGM